MFTKKQNGLCECRQRCLCRLALCRSALCHLVCIGDQSWFQQSQGLPEISIGQATMDLREASMDQRRVSGGNRDKVSESRTNLCGGAD